MNKKGWFKLLGLCAGLSLAVGAGVALSSGGAMEVGADEELVYTLDGTSTGGSNGYATASEITQGDILWMATGNTTINPWRIGGKNLSGTDRAIYSTAGITDNVSKIEVDSGSSTLSSVNSLTISVHNSSADAASGNNAIATKTESVSNNIISKTVTFSKSDSADWSGKYYRIVYNVDAGSSNQYVQFKSAKFYKEIQNYDVTFDLNGHGSSIPKQTKPEGGKVDKPTDPTDDAYDFGGWYKEQACTNAWNFNSDTVSSATTLYAKWTIKKYDVTGNITRGSLTVPSQIEHGGSLDVTIKADAGYNVPEDIADIAVTGATLDAYNAETGVISLTNATGAVTVTATCPAAGQTFSISVSVTGGEYSGDTHITDQGGVASVAIEATGDHKLPSSVNVTNADFTYNSSTGVVSLSNATGNVTITATCPDLTSYDIGVSASNGTYTGATSVKESRSATITFTPSSNYGQPDDVTVTGAIKSWDSSTGVLTLSNPTGAVTVTYVAVENELKSITLGAKKTAYILGEEFSMPVVTAHYSVDADKVVTESATESGYDPYSIGDQPITISYTEDGITKTSSYSVTVSVNSIQNITTWNIVENANELSAGDVIVIAGAVGSDYETKALSTTQNTNNRASTDISVSDGVATITDSVQQLTLTDTSALHSGSFGLSTGSGYLYAAASGANQMKTQVNNNVNGAWVIGISNNVASISADGSSNRHVMQLNPNNGTPIFNCYSSLSNTGLSIYKKTETQTGTADLIRITATYNGGEKFVGDSISASDFTVTKQLNTSAELISVESGWTIDVATLASTSNDVTVSYTEGGITKSVVVTVSATERTATLEKVVLSVGEEVQLDGYIAWSGAAWNLNDIKVQYIWSDSEYDTEATLQSLVDGGDASIDPATPTLGATSFTVTYSYMEVDLSNATVTLDKAVRSDYVSSMSWSNTTAVHFKHFSGEQLTEEIVNTWSVKATYAGAGEGSRLYWGDYDLYIGDKQITSLPYTWTTADDGEALSIHYGEDIDGNEFVKTNTTAVGNVCAVINEISHSETVSEEKTIDNMITNAVYTEGKTGTSGSGSDTEFTDANGYVKFNSDKGYKSSGTQLRVYAGGTYEISSQYTIKTITFTVSSGYEGGLDGDPITVNAKSWESTNSTGKQARITGIAVVIDFEGTDTVVYANQMDHFAEQKAVVKFAKAFNAAMDTTSNCSENMDTAWEACESAWDTFLEEAEASGNRAYCLSMLQYASAQYSDDSEAACVERMMRTYEICVKTHGMNAFMSELVSLSSASRTSPINSIINSETTMPIIVIVSLLSISAVGGYLFLRRRNEQ